MADSLPKTVLQIALAVAVLGVAVGAVAQVGDENRSRVSVDQRLSGTDWATIGNYYGTNETVRRSQGYAIQLDGTPGSKYTVDDITVATDERYTVCTWARVGNKTATMTALDVDGRLNLGYNGTTSNWTLWYYDDGSRSSFRLEASATNPDQGLTQLCGWLNDSELRFYVNASREGRVGNVSNASVAAAPVNATTWNGTLEETRTFDRPLNASWRNATYQQPNAPLPGADRTARIMFDQGAGDTEPVFWADATAQLQGHAWVQGHPAAVLDRDSLLSPGDYKWRTQGPEIRPVDSARLDGAPVAYVDYTKHVTNPDFPWTAWIGAMLGTLMLVAIGRRVTDAM